MISIGWTRAIYRGHHIPFQGTRKILKFLLTFGLDNGGHYTVVITYISEI